MRFILAGIRDGFRIGFDRRCPLRSAHRNIPSAVEHPQVVSEYIAKELMLGRMIGPFQREELATVPELHINRFGVIPNGHNTGKWRLITSLGPRPSRDSRNHLADDLSRDNLSSFLSKVPEAAKTPDRPSPSLLSLLLDPHIDWVSQNWRRQFADIFRKVLPPPQDGPTTRQ